MNSLVLYTISSRKIYLILQRNFIYFQMVAVARTAIKLYYGLCYRLEYLMKRFKKVQQFFPVRGHGYLPCDRHFGVIKRSITKQDRIYFPEDDAKIIASTGKGKLTVDLSQTNDTVYDFKKWWPKYFKKNVLSVQSFGKNVPKEEKKSFKISTFSSFEYYSDGSVIAGEFIDGLLHHTFKLSKSIQLLTSIALPTEKAFPNGSMNPINSKKLMTSQKIQQYIVDDPDNFYRSILSWVSTETEEND